MFVESLFMVAIIATSAPHSQTETGENPTHTYTMDSKSAPTLTRGYMFFERRMQYAGYLDNGTSSEEGMILRRYGRKVEKNVVSTSFNDLSIPKTVSNNARWAYAGRECVATQRSRDVFTILCYPDKVSHKDHLVYEYKLNVGITGFYKECLYEKDCWYSLVSKSGLLK